VFAVFCPSVGAQVLIWPSEIRSVTNAPDGIHVRFTCACGCEGTGHTGATAAAHVHPCLASEPAPDLTAA
jgi:hypothetical protein